MSDEKKVEKKETEIIKTEELPTEVKDKVSKLDSFNSVEDMKTFAQTLIDSKIIPSSYDSPEKIITVISAGRELGLSPIMSLYNMPFVGSKPTLGVHAIGALIRKGGVVWTTIEDAQQYKDIEDTVKLDADGKPDVRTVIEFKRFSKELDEVVIERMTFTKSEAKKAGLWGKNAWFTYPFIMLWNRTFVMGARRIAPDLLMGISETSEMAHVVDIDYTTDAEGEVVSIEKKD